MKYLLEVYFDDEFQWQSDEPIDNLDDARRFARVAVYALQQWHTERVSIVIAECIQPTGYTPTNRIKHLL